MHKFPSINQFRNAVKYARLRAQYVGRDELGNAVYDSTITEYPKIDYRLTVKLHGTNAGIALNTQGDLTFQSRERVLSATEDNAGFYKEFIQHEEILRDGMQRALNSCNEVLGETTSITVYGEWCGQGIQKGVAISELPRMFVVFGFRAETANGLRYFASDSLWEFAGDLLKVPGVKLIHQFPYQVVTVDFNRPEDVQNQLIEYCTQIEERCPVGTYFGVEGIGEGFVAVPVEDQYRDQSDYWFKVKGEKHSPTKVKTLAAVDVEAVENMRKFVEATVTPARLEQGLDVLQREMQKPFEMSSLGDFIRWVHNDIVKEETDLIEASGLDPKKIGSHVAPAARKWYVEQYNLKG